RVPVRSLGFYHSNTDYDLIIRVDVIKVLLTQFLGRQPVQGSDRSQYIPIAHDVNRCGPRRLLQQPSKPLTGEMPVLAPRVYSFTTRDPADTMSRRQKHPSRLQDTIEVPECRPHIVNHL